MEMDLKSLVERLKNEVLSVARQLSEEERNMLAEELRKIAEELKFILAPINCPRCGELMELVEVRPGHKPGLREVRIWRCRKCSLVVEQKIIDAEVLMARPPGVYVYEF